MDYLVVDPSELKEKVDWVLGIRQTADRQRSFTQIKHVPIE